jgi:hypothetical protein
MPISTRGTPVWWMTGTSLGSFLPVALWFERATAATVLVGMLGPLVMAIVTWVLTEQTFRRNPGGVTAMMVAAFGVKMVFVALYLVVMLRLVAVESMPFVASFTSYFVLLYAIEAFYLKRLFEGGRGGVREP